MSNNPTNELSSLVREIVQSYKSEPGTRHIDAGNLPSRAAVIEIIELLRVLLFPGYFGRQNLESATLEYYVGETLMSARELLHKQIRRALKHEAARRGEVAEGADERAEGIAFEFLQSIPKLRTVLGTDVQAAFDGDPAAEYPDEIIFSYPGFFAITVYRVAHALLLRGVPLIPRMMSEYAHAVTGVDIHAGASIDEYFFIDHGTGVVIGETSVIGRHVKIYQGVTLGALSTRGGQKLRGVRRHPTLEDSVTVYAGASILGGETVIGQGAVISSNVFVTQSVPPHTRVTVKNPELQYRDQKPREFQQEMPHDWVI